MDLSFDPIVEATRIHDDGSAMQWRIFAADDRWLVSRAVGTEHGWVADSAAVVDTLDLALGHHPELTVVPTDSRLRVVVDESELQAEEFAAWLRVDHGPDHDLPGWCDPDPMVRINDHVVCFLPLDQDLVAVVRGSGGEVLGRRLAVHRWIDRDFPSVSGADELVEINPGIAVSVTRDSEPQVFSLGTSTAVRSDRTVAWVEHVVEPGLLLFEPAPDDPTRRDWLVAREDHCHRFEFSFGDETDHLLRVRRMAVLHPDVDVDFLWNEMSSVGDDVDLPVQRTGSAAVRTS